MPFLISRLDVFEGEIYQTVLVAGAHIKEIVTIHLDVLDGDVVALTEWHILAVAWFEELGPRADNQETACGACDIIYRHILIVLRSIRAHLQPEYALRIAHLDVAQHDIAVFHTLAAQSQTTMHSTIVAVLDEHIIDWSILWCLVCPGSLTALDGNGIIITLMKQPSTNTSWHTSISIASLLGARIPLVGAKMVHPKKRTWSQR